MKEKNIIADLFLRLLGGCIIDYAWSPGQLRLMITSPAAGLLAADQTAIQVVLEDCRELYYLSYTQTQEERVVQQDPLLIFDKQLQLLGVQEKAQGHLILYCSSFQDIVEAGELHLTAGSVRLYDQEFGHLSYEQFCRASDKYSRFST